MAAKGLSVVISATDRATGVINKVNAGFDAVAKRTAGISAAGDRFGAAFQKLGENTGIVRAAESAKVLSGRIARVAGDLGRFAPALAGVGSAASLAGIAAVANRWTQFGSELQRSSMRGGIAAERLHALQGAARLAGSSAEAATEGMRTLQDGLTNAVSGRAPEVVQMLSSLGIAFTDARTGGARLATDALPEIADKIAKLRDPTLQARAATALFGGAAESLLPFLRRGAKGIEEYTDQARRYGVMNEAGVEAARQFEQAQSRVGLAVEGVGYAVSQRLAPVLIPLLDRFATWISSHREDIAGFFGEIATKLDEWVKADGPEKMWKGIERVGTVIKSVTDLFGGMTGAAEALLGFMVGRWALGMVASIARVTLAFREMKAAMPAGAGTPALPAPGGAPGRGGPGALGIFGGLLGAYSMFQDLRGGVTDEDRRSLNEDSFIAKLGKVLGEAIGMKFDEHGNSPGAMGGGGWFNRQINRPAGAGILPGPAQPMGPISSSPYANNNPTNLAYYPGQRGVQGANGRWGVYQTPEVGAAAGLDQMLRDAEQKGFRTLADEIQHRSPPSENNTLSMIRDISGWSGMKPDENLDLRDPARAERFLTAVIRREQGRAPDPEMVRRAVGMSLGTGSAGTPAVSVPPLAPPIATVPAPVAAPAGATGQNTTAESTHRLRIDLAGQTDGVRTSLTSTGGGLRVEMPSLGGNGHP